MNNSSYVPHLSADDIESKAERAIKHFDADALKKPGVIRVEEFITTA